MAQLKTGTTIGGRDVMLEIDNLGEEVIEHQNDYVKQMAFATASGTNTYAVTIEGITVLVEGLSVKVKFANANTAASTLNINNLGAKAIKKGNGNDLAAGNIKAGQICHLVYTGVNFQLLGEGGEYGTAQTQHVLTPYTIGTENGIMQGTMPDRGAVVITPSTQNKPIDEGYHNGGGYVVGDSNLKAENIKKGVSIFGVNGSFLHVLYSYGTEYVPWVTGYSTGSGASQSKESDHLYFYHPESRETERTYVTDTTINLSNVLALIVEWEGLSDEVRSSSAYEPYLVVSSSRTGSGTSGVGTFLSGPTGASFPRIVEMLDVSSLTGSYYIRIHSRCRSTLSDKPIQRKIYYVGLAVK